MECEMCGQEVVNSEELQRHTERFHPNPANESATSDKGGERPDWPASESETSEAPEPAQKRR